MNKYPVFIISQGRDGSTLLLRLLNQIPGFNLYGENWNFLGQMMDINHYLNQIHYHHKEQIISRFTYDEYENTSSTFKPSWYNNYSIEDANNNTKKYIESILNPNNYRVWGCKEIRWGVDYWYFIENGINLIPYSEFKKRLDQIKVLYPNCKFIFTSRNLKNQLKSGWWKGHKISKKILQGLNEYHNSYIKTSNNSYSVTYEDILECNNNYKNLYKFLGEKFSYKSYKKIINRKAID